jgi:hypothetical protein
MLKRTALLLCAATVLSTLAPSTADAWGVREIPNYNLPDSRRRESGSSAVTVAKRPSSSFGGTRPAPHLQVQAEGSATRPRLRQLEEPVGPDVPHVPR